jgi:hypothetical protein
MKRHIYIFTIFLSLTLETTLAHQDFFVRERFGNVKVQIKTGFNYEEIQKVLIIAELVKNLLEELNYSDTVFLDFNHFYIDYCIPDYFISYDNGNIIQNWRNDNTKKNLKEKSIVVRQVSRTFNILTTLRLVEYAIQKFPEIELKQKSIVYNKNFCDWTINTIDTSEIKKTTV